jgi:outer membrane lipoprotein carrier protein
VNLYWLGAALLAAPVFAAPPDSPPLSAVLKEIEARYNHSKTLQVSFSEQYTPSGGPQRKESGTLFLRKPMRMRCEYNLPKGKLCVSDGTTLYVYTPSDNRAMRIKLKDSLAEDMHAPLAFLLGKLNFDKEFRNLQSRQEGAANRISGQPKNEIYASIEFLAGSGGVIQELKITSVDHSILNFTFSNEKQDLPISEKLFIFQLPAGAQWDENGQ